MRGKRAYLGKRRKSPEEELWEILCQPVKDHEHRRMLAWYKLEKEKFGRVHTGAYVTWLEQQFGPIENAEDSWLTTCFGEPAPKF
jgi:hypothetical protein